MRLNNDCIRDILISVESLDFGQTLSLDDLSNMLPGYTLAELEYHCLKLHEAGFLKAILARILGSPNQIARITDLTYEGHQFLANIRSDTTWNKTKEIAKSVGVSSVGALKEIATAVVTSLIQNQLGLQ